MVLCSATGGYADALLYISITDLYNSALFNVIAFSLFYPYCEPLLKKTLKWLEKLRRTTIYKSVRQIRKPILY